MVLPPVFLCEVYDTYNREYTADEEHDYKGGQVVGFDLEIGIYLEKPRGFDPFGHTGLTHPGKIS